METELPGALVFVMQRNLWASKHLISRNHSRKTPTKVVACLSSSIQLLHIAWNLRLGRQISDSRGVVGLAAFGRRKSSAMAESRQKKRIFVVDDEHAVASTLALVLNIEGYHALSFTQPLEALKAARSEAPDLLLTDVMMPLLSGVDLAIQMLENCPNCKVLLFSGMPDSIDLMKDSQAQGHAFEFLPKPMHPKELLCKIQQAIDTPSPPLPANPAEHVAAPHPPR